MCCKDGPLLFNLFINDFVLFLSNTFLSNYADENNLYSAGEELDIIKKKLPKIFKIVTDLFIESYMSFNLTKCHYMCLGKNKENDTFNFKNASLKNWEKEVILGLTIGNTVNILIWHASPLTDNFQGT